MKQVQNYIIKKNNAQKKFKKFFKIKNKGEGLV